MSGTPTSRPFTDTVTLKPAEPQHFDLAYTATTQPCPWPKAYGGDLVAQAATAAMRSVTDGKTLHSTHSYFMRPAEIGAEIRYEVEVLRDGRGYSTRQVRAFQNGKPVVVCLADFAAGEAGGEYADGGGEVDTVPAPDELPSSAQYLADPRADVTGRLDERTRVYWSGGRSFDMRHVPGPVYLTVEGAREPHQAVWVRPFDPLRPVPGTTAAQRDLAALAYVCDFTILEPLLRVLGLPWTQPGLMTASLDHAMWFHRPPAPGVMNGWLLYSQHAVAAAGGRGTSTGRFHTPDGTHLATVVQEGLIRPATGGNR